MHHSLTNRESSKIEVGQYSCQWLTSCFGSLIGVTVVLVSETSPRINWYPDWEVAEMLWIPDWLAPTLHWKTCKILKQLISLFFMPLTLPCKRAPSLHFAMGEGQQWRTGGAMKAGPQSSCCSVQLGRSEWCSCFTMPSYKVNNWLHFCHCRRILSQTIARGGSSVYGTLSTSCHLSDRKNRPMADC